MKFLAWFFAILVFFSSFFVALTYNSRQLFLTPENSKKVLQETDFYAQVRSVLKKDLFETNTENTESIAAISKATASALDKFDFQTTTEKLISDFYSGISSKDGLSIKIDLRQFKSDFLGDIDALTTSAVSPEDLTIPDEWKLDLSSYSLTTSSLGFVYSNYNFILIGYFILVVLFLAFCLLVNFRYLKLFFWTFLVFGLLLLLQRFAWGLIDPDKLLSAIFSQGRSGLEILAENFISYFKQESSKLLIRESLFICIPSLVGIIVVSLIPEKINKIPLESAKVK